jgi:hypothetical protein
MQKGNLNLVLKASSQLLTLSHIITGVLRYKGHDI